MIKAYQNQHGKMVIIRDMSDRYLGNAIKYFENILSIYNDNNDFTPDTQCGGFCAIDTSGLEDIIIALRFEERWRTGDITRKEAKIYELSPVVGSWELEKSTNAQRDFDILE